ncbi:Ig-like domain-containing protein [Crocinitomicaceae bacterium]|nr:Ig-like domain-containing protein [Crocinitomicaceae bacterium]
MAGKYYVILLLALLSSCAQVDSITGGPEDEFAPKPMEELMEPQNATTNYTGNTFVIPFDEYFQLNNPAQTIRMVPPHATVIAEMKRKTLYLSWEDTLEANTTYAIYLNGTVKDLNQGNDTTLQLVFSTGAVLDTTSYTVGVVDAFTGEPISDLTVALFDPESNRLKSLARSDRGVAKLNYLTPGNYTIRAFEDKNLDLEPQDDERVGFTESGTITVDTNYFDSIPIRTYAPFPNQRYKVKSFIPPATFELEATADIRYYGLKNAKVNGKEASFLSDEKKGTYYVVSPDTMGENITEVEITHITDSTDVIDTLSYRFRNKEREGPIVMKSLHETVIAPGDTLKYELYGQVSGWQDTLIELMQTEDSMIITSYDILLNDHQLFLKMDESVKGKVQLTFKKGAIQTPFGNSKAFKETVSMNSEDDYGVLNINLSGYTSPIVLEMLKGSSIDKKMIIEGPTQVLKLELLKPGSYTFRVIRDDNGNGLWDIGNLETLTQPERVDSYSKEVKVRANWEVEITLNPSENE